MPIIKRLNRHQGLRDIDVFIEEKGLNSEYFNVTGMPAEVPQGKSSFLVGGSPFLKNNIEIKIEMLDSAGQTIYMEPVSNYLESGARRVSIEVYPDTAPGIAKLYLLGELKRNFKDFQQPIAPSTEITDPPFSAATPPSQAFLSQFEPDVPSNFQGVYNVRYEMPVQINTTIPNTQPILFYKQPRLTVREIVKGFVHESVPSSSYGVSGSLSIDRIPESQPEAPPAEPPDGQPTGLTESDRNDVGKGLSIFKNRRSFKRDPYRNSLFAKRGRVMRRSSPEVDKSSAIIKNVTSTPENDVDKITSTFVGETLNINNITIDTSTLPYSVPYTMTGSYSTKVKSVLNDTTFVPIDDFTVTLANGEKYPANITNASFTASIHPTPGFLVSTTEFRSFADITIGNLRTFSGDVYKAIVYGKSKGSLGDFEPMYEAFIESSEVLIDKLSPTGFTSTAYFYTQSIVDAYWNVTDGTAIESDEVIIDGVTISGSNYNADKFVKFSTKHVYDLEPNVAYNVQFSTYYYKAPTINPNNTTEVINDAVLEVYVTGSKAGGKELLGRVNVGEAPEGKIDSIFKTFISAPVSAPKMALEFHVKAGRFILQDLSVRPMSETNFNPDYHRVIVPMPHPMPVKPDTYDFVVELFDVNNNLAETFATTENVEFTGAPMIISGPGNFLSGSMMLGTGMELYGGSAFLRTTGYRGMKHAIANNKGGFMVWSGSIGDGATKNLITASAGDVYDGVGLDIIDAHDSNNIRFLKFGTNPSKFEVVTDTFFLGKPRTQANSQFVSGSGGNIEISSSFFHLTPVGNVTGSAILLGSKTDNQYLQYTTGSGLVVKGDLSVDQITTPATIGGNPSTLANASASITSDGFAKFVSASIGGFEVSTTQIKDTDDDLVLNSSGQITGSKVLFSGGRIANWDIIGDKLSSINTSDKGIILDADVSTPIIEIREDDDNRLQLYHTSNSDWGIVGKEGGNNIFRFGDTNKIAAWTFDDKRLSAFKTSTQDKFGISIDADYQLITFHGDAGDGKNNVGDNDRDNVMLAIGQLTDDKFGIKGWDSASGARIFELSPVRNEIAGWTIGNETLEGGDLILEKTGTIRSRGYQSDVAGSGFILTAASGGFLEVENAKIRGTLATAVFEKESVNAVGGQLYVANSTTLTASLVAPGGIHTATQETMSVVNASGFSNGEILTIKKVHQTGFNTEYLLVNSSSRNDPTSDNDQSGLIFVTRGYGQGTSGDSGSLGGPAGSATSYSGSQVVVSTGKIGTGYIRLNANPNDQATPYMDIVERTGAGLYDVELKARLGDLSGVAGSRNVPLGFTGFGLMSEVAFLSGSMIKLESPEFILGDKNRNFVSASNGNFEISSSAFHLQPDGDFILGQTEYSSSVLSNPSSVSHNGGNIQPIPTSLPASNNVTFTLPNEYSNFTGRIDITDVTMTATNTGGSMSGMPQFAAIYLVFDDQVKASDGSSVSNQNWRIQQGASTITGTDTSTDTSVKVTTGSIAAKVYGNSIANNGNQGRVTALSFNAQFDTDYAIKYYKPAINYNNTTSDFQLNTKKFFMGDSTTQFISGSGGLMEISSSGYHLKTDGGFNLGDKLIWDGSTLTVTGTINITGGSGTGVTQGVLDAAIEGAISTGSVSASVAESQASASVASSIMTNANGQITIPNDTPSGTGLFLTANYLGYYSSDWDVFIGSTGNFLFKGDDDNLVSFNGSDFVLKAQNATLSGSQINLLSEKFYYGGNSQYISGSDGNLEITSSMFHLEPTGRFSVGNTPTAYATRSGANFHDGTLTPTYSQSTFDTLDINNTLFRFDWKTDTQTITTPDVMENTGASWSNSPAATYVTSPSLLGTHSFHTAEGDNDKFYAHNDPHGTTTDTMNNFSISFWVYIPATPDDHDCIIAHGTSHQGFHISYLNSTSKFGFQYYVDGYNNNGPQVRLDFNTMALNTWHHLAAVVSTRKKFIQIFQNGDMVDHVPEHEFMNRQLDFDHGHGVGITYSSSNYWSIGYLEYNLRFNISNGNYGSLNSGGDSKFTNMYMQDLRVVQYERPASSIRAMVDFVNNKDNPVNSSSAIVATTSSLNLNSIDFTLGSNTTSFVKHDSSGLEISSSNFHVSQSGQITAISQKLGGVSEADYFSYRNDTISSTGNKHDGYYLYYLQGGVPYTCLYLVGDRTSQRQREASPFRKSHAASMVRINHAPKYPFGMILTPGNRGGAQVIMEVATDTYFMKQKGANFRGPSGLASWATSSLLNPHTFDQSLDQNIKKYLADNVAGDPEEDILDEQFSTSRYGFMADADDHFGGTHYNAFYSGSLTVSNTNDELTITGSYDYDGVGKVTAGSRIVWVKSRFDFRPIVFSGRNHAPQFYSGLALSNRTIEAADGPVGVEIQGGTRCNFYGARNADNVADEFLRGTNGVPFSGTVGYTMTRPGSVTAISLNAIDSGGTFDGWCRVIKNNSYLTAMQVTGQGTSHFNLFKTIPRNRVIGGNSARFVAGDMLNLYIDTDGNGGSLDYPIAFFEVTYDT